MRYVIQSCIPAKPNTIAVTPKTPGIKNKFTKLFKLNNSVLIFVTHTITNMEVDISSGKIKVFNGKKKLKITVKFPIMNNEIKG